MRKIERIKEFKFRLFSKKKSISILMLILNIVTSIIVMNIIYKENYRRNWPEVQGKILTSNIEVVTEYMGFGVRGSPDYQYYDRFRLLIRYEYTVSGNKFVSEEYIYEDRNNVKLWIENRECEINQLKNAYPVGNYIKILYNPQNPQNTIILDAEEMKRFNGLIIILVTLIGSIIYQIYKIYVPINDLSQKPEKINEIKINWPNGDSFIGIVEADNSLYKGTYIWAHGEKYTGGFDNGQMDGYGKYFWMDGSIYEGEWNKGAIDGWGKMTRPNGVEQEGYFKDGYYLGKSLY